jgi:hypothetical protein
MARPIVVPGAPARVARTTPPATLPGATRFSDEPGAFLDPAQLVLRVKGIRPVMRILDAAQIDHGHGPARRPGNWALLYLSFTVSREVNVQPWYRRESGNGALWRACGFRTVPAYQTVWQRFAELEVHAEVFTRAASELIQTARRKDPRVGMWWAVDGTECQTHAQPQHDCGPNDDCPTRNGGRATLAKVGIEDAGTLRQADSVVEDDVISGVVTGSGSSSSSPSGSLDPIPPKGTADVTEDGLRWSNGTHWWRTRDREAGWRMYQGNKFWFGNMNIKAVDVFTGAVLAVEVAPAKENEPDVLPRLYERGIHAVGTDPIAMIADRGYATDDVHRFLTTRDVTPVIPYRKRHHGDGGRAAESDRVDRHGIPKCRHCGQPGDFVRFNEKGNTPRVWFRCSLPVGDECAKEQSIACTEDIRRILPLWRTSPVYGALRNQMGVNEHAHEDWRTYFRSGGKNLRERPRRIGIACQQLRANAALVAQWVWVLVRQGWLGSRADRAEAKVLPTGRYLQTILKARRKHSLMGGGYPTRHGPPPSRAE